MLVEDILLEPSQSVRLHPWRKEVDLHVFQTRERPFGDPREIRGVRWVPTCGTYDHEI